VIYAALDQCALAPHRNVTSNAAAHALARRAWKAGAVGMTKNSRAALGRVSKNPERRAMAGDRAQNLQDTFLNHVRKAKIPLTIFLVNGVKLQGVVTWFDNFCVLLRRDGHSQLVYKHAISTIMPGHPIQLFEGAEEAPAGEKV
jgi:host factor-I protein